MNINPEQLTVKELKNGYCYCEKTDDYACNLCGQRFANGEIYPLDGHLYEAYRAAGEHIRREHADYFHILLSLDSKYVSFTENQRTLLTLFHAGLSDQEAAQRLSISPSTVRHQKFTFREKAKQAKMYLTLYEMAIEGSPESRDSILPVPMYAKMVDDRYIVTSQERDKILATAFSSLSPLKLIKFSSKEKKKLVILTKIAEQFAQDRKYAEKEVNQILSEIYGDYVTLRRYLIEYGFMDRTRDCKTYWLK